MITAATLMQRVPARTRVLLVLLIAAFTVALVIAAAFHGTPVHGTGAMYHDPQPNMYHD
jgi:hypothetical protein